MKYPFLLWAKCYEREKVFDCSNSASTVCNSKLLPYEQKPQISHDGWTLQNEIERSGQLSAGYS